MTRRVPNRRHRIGLLSVAALAIPLAGCAGYSAARDMTAEEIAAQSDEWVCERLRVFAAKGRLPEAWSDASARRGLDRCILDGVERRRQEDEAERRRPLSCETAGRVKAPECW